MKLEVGMYCYIKNFREYGIGIIDYILDNNLCTIDFQHNAHKVSCDNVIASHNIMDLIEIGDIILFRLNGDLYKYEVEEIPSFDKYLKVISMNICKQRKIFELNELNILGILTKEQFENNCFKIGDE